MKNYRYSKDRIWIQIGIRVINSGPYTDPESQHYRYTTDTRIIFKLTLDYASEALNQSSGKNINLRVIYREMCPLVHQMFSNIDGGRLARVTCNILTSYNGLETNRLPNPAPKSMQEDY